MLDEDSVMESKLPLRIEKFVVEKLRWYVARRALFSPALGKSLYMPIVPAKVRNAALKYREEHDEPKWQPHVVGSDEEMSDGEDGDMDAGSTGEGGGGGGGGRVEGEGSQVDGGGGEGHGDEHTPVASPRAVEGADDVSPALLPFNTPEKNHGYVYDAEEAKALGLSNEVEWRAYIKKHIESVARDERLNKAGKFRGLTMGDIQWMVDNDIKVHPSLIEEANKKVPPPPPPPKKPTKKQFKAIEAAYEAWQLENIRRENKGLPPLQWVPPAF
eukprot:jgi/Mesvir1/5224/Mv15353-RA.1